MGFNSGFKGLMKIRPVGGGWTDRQTFQS